MPFGNCDAPIHFTGDLILFAYLLGLARFCTVLAALDTGSAFEGMGASREVFFSTMVEPALLLALAAIGREAVGRSILIEPDRSASPHQRSLWSDSGLFLVFAMIALFLVLLTECSRIPVDDPNTHLELTMIHEVMVLDHGGPDFAYILYGAALKMWLLGALVVGMILPATDNTAVDLPLSLAAMFVIAVTVGVVESVMARLRMVRVPQLLAGATHAGHPGSGSGVPLAMTSPTELVLILVLLTDLITVSIADVRLSIRVVTIQGIALGFLSLLMMEDDFNLNLLIIALGTFVMKGYVFPWLLYRTLRTANVRNESVPTVGFTLSKVIGVLLIVSSFWLASRFGQLTEATAPFGVDATRGPGHVAVRIVPHHHSAAGAHAGAGVSDA